MMMNMFDRDGSGSITFNEFIGLWNYIEKWKACFQNYDLDGSGTIDGHELQQALRGFGYNLSDAMVQMVVTKYDVRGRGDISFDNFVQSCVTIQALTESFRRYDTQGVGIVTMTYEQVKKKKKNVPFVCILFFYCCMHVCPCMFLCVSKATRAISLVSVLMNTRMGGGVAVLLGCSLRTDHRL
jgi:Ca2+-binding EF-hand superfamily protein